MHMDIEAGSTGDSDLSLKATLPCRLDDNLLDSPTGRATRKPSDLAPVPSSIPPIPSIPSVRTGRPRGRSPDPLVRRQELLAAAIRAVHRLGPGASMGDIAAEANLTKPVVYACFQSKAGLGRAILEHYLTQVRREALIAMGGESSQRAVVRAIVAPLVAFVEREPDVYRFLIVALETCAGTRSPSLFGPLGLLADQLSLGFDTVFKRSGADPRPAEMLAYSVLATTFASVEWWDRQTPRLTSAEEITEWVSDFICGGLAEIALVQ